MSGPTIVILKDPKLRFATELEGPSINISADKERAFHDERAKEYRKKCAHWEAWALHAFEAVESSIQQWTTTYEDCLSWQHAYQVDGKSFELEGQPMHRPIVARFRVGLAKDAALSIGIPFSTYPPPGFHTVLHQRLQDAFKEVATDSFRWDAPIEEEKAFENTHALDSAGTKSHLQFLYGGLVIDRPDHARLNIKLHEATFDFCTVFSETDNEKVSGLQLVIATKERVFRFSCENMSENFVSFFSWKTFSTTTEARDFVLDEHEFFKFIQHAERFSRTGYPEWSSPPIY